jgi:hypothetical protein
VSLRQASVATLVLGALAASLVLMVDDALSSGDWPGWEEA